MSSDEIAEAAKKLKINGFGGVILRGNLRHELKKTKRSCVINLDDVDAAGAALRGGTHWVAFCGDAYFDSFGSPPPDELLGIRKIKMYSSTVNQDPADVSCGYWCLMFLHLMQKNGYDFQKTSADISNVSLEELAELVN